jgi:hypothetical protein
MTSLAIWFFYTLVGCGGFLVFISIRFLWKVFIKPIDTQEEIRICKDCIFCNEYYDCTHPESKTTNLVTGGEIVKSCSFMRGFGYCDAEGKFYKGKG